MSDSNAGLSEAKRALLRQRMRDNGSARGAHTAVLTHGQDGPAPLSTMQDQLWHFSRLAPDNPVYNEAISIRKSGAFDATAFQSAFTELIRRHQIWRSSFAVVDGEPAQITHAARAVELPVVDLSALGSADAVLEAGRLAAEQASRPYDLATGPLLRPLLVRIAADDHRLYLALHHMIFDGFSLYRVVLPELVALYEDFAAGRAPTLPEAAVQYADYSRWSRQRSRSDEVARLDYWRTHLEGAPTLDLPFDRPRPAHAAFRGAMEAMLIARPLADRLRALSREAGASLFQTMSAAFAVFLQRYSDQDEVVFGTVADQRQRPELEAMVGYCLTPLVLRASLGADPSFTELVRSVRTEVLDGLDHILPFDSLVRELRPPRHTAANPIFQVTIVLEPPMVATDPEWSLHQMDAIVGNAVGHAKFDLSIELDERPDGEIHGRLIYDRDLFDQATAKRMIEHWDSLLRGIVTNPSVPVSALPILTSADNERLASWNATDAEIPSQSCVHDLIATQARTAPHAPAVIAAEGNISYGELDERAGRLAAHLHQRGVTTGDIVGIHLERSMDMMVALLATMKAGAAYLPLEPGHPSQRLAAIVADARPVATITTSALVDGLPASRHGIVLIDTERDAWMAAEPLSPTSDPRTLAYVMYTSGSTGAPKGVLIEHGALVNQLTWCVESFHLSPEDRVLQKTPLAFDASVWELFAPLICGATVVLLAPEAHRDPQRIAATIGEQRVTVAQFVPSMLELYLAATRGSIDERLRFVAVGGERLSTTLVQRFFERFGADVELRNLYGPTEACINATSWRCTGGEGVVPVGRPVANTQVEVLDAALRRAPIGAVGELCIAGVQLARGYLDRPELTAERFIEDPSRPGRRLYRTGDRARWRNDGTLEYLGRRDDQVKIRGNRIELGEVETAVAAHALVGSCVVVVVEDRGEESLVAYVTARDGQRAPSVVELRAHVADRLTAAMMPTAFVAVDEIPLMPNGKADRRTLARQPWRRESSSSRAPRSATEQRLAAIWARVLDVASIGIDADFFDLGGHSLMAARLLTEVERETGVAVPLSAVIEGEFTIAAMGALVDGDAKNAHGVAPAPDSSGTASPALFFFHSDESTMFTLRHFMGPLGENQRVVGLLPERIARRFNRASSVEELARPLLETIRAVQPHGPYYLAGFSLGALLAYETASRLLEAGEEVAWLGNLDCETPEVGRRLVWLRSPRGFLRRLVERGPRRAARKAFRLAWRALRAPLVRLDLLPPLLSDGFDAEGATTLGVRYEVRGNAAPMELFVSADVVDMTGEPSLGWERVHDGEITVHHIPGTHVSMLTEPYVLVVADIVSASLRRAQLGAVAPSA
jgi:amino acid adenylation domain-containing protein